MTRRDQVGDIFAPAAVSEVGEPVRGAADRPPQSAQGWALVGRQAELDTLQGFLGEAATRGGTLLLSGEPGVGKTALLEDAVTRPHDLGLQVVRAAGAEFEVIQITDVGAEVRDLCERHEQIHTWGSANLLQTLFREALVDRVNLWVCPVVIGQGTKLFPEGTAATRFEQVEPPKSFPGGVVLLRYRRLEGGPPKTVTKAVNAED
jgi:hypothetical protein